VLTNFLLILLSHVIWSAVALLFLDIWNKIPWGSGASSEQMFGVDCWKAALLGLLPAMLILRIMGIPQSVIGFYTAAALIVLVPGIFREWKRMRSGTH